MPRCSLTLSDVRGPTLSISASNAPCICFALPVSDDVEKIAAAVGYADGVTLRNLLRRKLGRGVREIRAERAAG